MSNNDTPLVQTEKQVEELKKEVNNKKNGALSYPHRFNQFISILLQFFYLDDHIQTDEKIKLYTKLDPKDKHKDKNSLREEFEAAIKS